MFTSIFFLEMVIKLTGLGFLDYFRDKFNAFDCFIVFVSLFDFISLIFNFSSGGSAIAALRGFRLLRVFKLA